MRRLIIEALSRVLDSLISDVNIYYETTKQDLKLPCFNIMFIKSSSKHLLGGMYRLGNPIHIVFISKTNEKFDLLDIAEQMEKCLEILPITDNFKIRGTNINFEIEEDILHFFIEYDFNVRELEKLKNLMENSEVNINGK